MSRMTWEDGGGRPEAASGRPPLPSGRPAISLGRSTSSAESSAGSPNYRSSTRRGSGGADRDSDGEAPAKESEVIGRQASLRRGYSTQSSGRSVADDKVDSGTAGAVLLQRAVVRGRHRKGLDIVGEAEVEDDTADDAVSEGFSPATKGSNPLMASPTSAGSEPMSPETAEFLTQALSHHYMFSSLAPSELSRVVAAMRPVPVKSGEVIMQSGDVLHNAFYVVQRGMVDLYGDPLSASFEAMANRDPQDKVALDDTDVAESDEPIFLMSVASGGTFGEAALLFDAPADMTVRTALLSLSASTLTAAAAESLFSPPTSKRTPSKMTFDDAHVARSPQYKPANIGEVLKSPRASCLMDVGATTEATATSVSRSPSHADGLRASQDQVQTAEHLLWRLDRRTFRRVLTSTATRNAQAISDALGRISLFKDLTSNQLSRLVYAVREQKFKAGDYVIRKGDPGDSLYFLLDGNVVCTNIGSGAIKVADVHLGPGACFGERALLLHEARAADVLVTSDFALLYRLDSTAVTQLLGPLQELLDWNVAANVIRSIPTFAKFQNINYDAIAKTVQTRTYAKGEVVLTDASSDEFFVIRDGEVQDEAGNVLGAGDFFGLDAALSHGHTARARYVGHSTKVTCYAASIKKMCEACSNLAVALGWTDEAEKATPDVASIVPATSVEHDMGSLPYLRSVARALNTDITLEDLERLVTVGIGTFGRVYMVRHRPTGHLYALKELKKTTLLKMNQLRNVQYEKCVMAAVNHPFLLRLVNTFQDTTKIYMLTEYIQGGELFNLLGEFEKLESQHAKFYAAGVLAGLTHLHSIGIVYRDLKPENLLIDRDGYIRIVDFGFCKHVPRGERTYTLCGTPAYIAYEMVKGTGYDHAVDLWALGTLMYEMLVGFAPYEAEDQMSTFRNILSARLEFPDWFNDHYGRDIIRQLLARDVVDRLGCRKDGAQEIFEHPWFEDIDFTKLVKKELPAPWLPELAAEDDARYFEQYEDSIGGGDNADEDGDLEEGEDVEDEEGEEGKGGEEEQEEEEEGQEEGGPDEDGEIEEDGEEDKFEYSSEIPKHLRASIDPSEIEKGASKAEEELPWFEGF